MNINYIITEVQESSRGNGAPSVRPIRYFMQGLRALTRTDTETGSDSISIPI